MIENIKGKVWKKGLLLTGIVIGVFLAFRYLLPLVVPFIIAGVISVLYYPFLRRLCKGRMVWEGKKKKWFLAVAVGLLYIILLLFCCLLGGYLFGQGQSILLNFPFYQAKVMYLVKCCCCRMDELLHIQDGSSYLYIEGMVGDPQWTDSLTEILPKVTSYSVQMVGKVFGILFAIVITVIATFFMIQDYEGIREKMLQSPAGRGICSIIQKCKETMRVYVKAQGFIMLLDGTICTLAFFLIGQPYFLVLGPVVAIVDALPVFGAGVILIPYAILLLFGGKIGNAAVLLLAYLACILVRQITEPRMVGDKVGMKPLYTIISMYVGVQLFGVFGFLLGPVGVLVVMELYRSLSSFEQ